MPGIWHLSRQTGGNLSIISLLVTAIPSLIQLISRCLRQHACTSHIEQLSKKNKIRERNRTDRNLYLQVNQSQHYPDTRRNVQVFFNLCYVVVVRTRIL